MTIPIKTLDEFIQTEHCNLAQATDWDIASLGPVFFEGECYIHSYENKWHVLLGNNEMQFDTKSSAIQYLYLNHYLVECTDLFQISEKFRSADILITELTTFWGDWCRLNRIPLESADEMLLNKDIMLSKKQKHFIETFCRLWDLTND